MHRRDQTARRDPKSGRQCRSKGTVGIGPPGGKSRWGHHGDSVVVFAPKVHSPGEWDLNPSFPPLVVESFQRLPNVLLRESGIARVLLKLPSSQRRPWADGPSTAHSVSEDRSPPPAPPRAPP